MPGKKLEHLGIKIELVGTIGVCVCVRSSLVCLLCVCVWAALTTDRVAD